MIRHTRGLSLLLVASLIALAGCRSSTTGSGVATEPVTAAAAGTDQTDPSSSSGSGSGSGSSSSGSGPGPGSGSTVASPLAFGPGSFDLPDPTVGLSSLSSYRATLTVTFVGTENGADASWSLTRVSTIDREASAHEWMDEQTGVAPLQRYRVDVAGMRYERLDGGPCATTLSEPQAVVSSDGDAAVPAVGPLADAEPAALLPGLLGADVVGAEAVDGVPATHATFDERSFGSLDPATSTGDVWVAIDGGFVVRYSLVTQGTSAHLGRGVDGLMTWEYELGTSGETTGITVPADCPVGLVDAATLADADAVVNVPGRLTYVTASTPADVDAFYRQQLMADGWLSDGSPLVGEDGSMSTFTRSTETLTVMAATVAGMSEVTILLGRAPA